MRKKLKGRQLTKVLEKAARSWKDEDHPEIKAKGTYRWVRSLRNSQKSW